MMKYELEKYKLNNAIFNNYTFIQPDAGYQKKLISRTKSEPLYRSTRNTSLEYRDLGFRDNPNQIRMHSPTRRLSPVLQCYEESMTNNEQQTSNNVYENTSQINLSGLASSSKKSNDESLISCHRRHSSISEKELNKVIFTGRKTIKPSKLSNKDLQDHIIIGEVNEAVAVHNADTSAGQDGYCQNIISQQPRPSSFVERYDTNVRHDECYRCLQRCEDAIRCVTCAWCLDAACYHFYKDDVGYSSWFQEIFTCRNSDDVKRNCKKLTLLGLAAAIFPCLLFYPILGGSLKLCMKCRRSLKEP